MSATPLGNPSPDRDDERRLREIFDAHHDFVWRSVRRLGIGLGDVDDVVQETFIVAGRKLSSFEGRSSVRTWLFGIAMRVAHTHRRSLERRRRRAGVYARGQRKQTDPHSRTDAVDLLAALLGELDEARRTAFVLADLEGCTAAEIAAEQGINVNTIYARIRSARKQLEEALSQWVEREGGEPWSR